MTRSRASRGGRAKARKFRQVVEERAKYLGMKVPRKWTASARDRVNTAFRKELARSGKTVSEIKQGKRYTKLKPELFAVPGWKGSEGWMYNVYRVVVVEVLIGKYQYGFERYRASSGYQPTREKAIEKIEFDIQSNADKYGYENIFPGCCVCEGILTDEMIVSGAMIPQDELHPYYGYNLVPYDIDRYQWGEVAGTEHEAVYEKWTYRRF